MIGRPRTRPLTYICKQCGGEFTDRRHGAHTRVYCSRQCANMARPSFSRSGRPNTGTPGNRFFIDKRSGYAICHTDDGNHILQHRDVMEKFLGRKLEKRETVHHKNGIRSDNRLENLELWTSNHGRGQRASDIAKDAFSGSLVTGWM